MNERMTDQELKFWTMFLDSLGQAGRDRLEIIAHEMSADPKTCKACDAWGKLDAKKGN